MPSEQEIKEFQEKVKDMSPEELKKLQKEQCIFCQIIEGKVNSKKVYEDEKCIAILDINPANPGHTLLIPKEHYPLMPLMPEDIQAHLFMVAKALSGKLLSAVGAEGTTTFIANGTAAGQRAQHFMLHIIPRKTGDNLPLTIPVNEFPADKIEEAKNKIQKQITAIFKQQKVVVEKPKKEQKPKKPKKEQKPKKPKKEQKPKPKKEQKPKKPKKEQKPKKPKEEQNTKETGISLDDISDVLGVQ